MNVTKKVVRYALLTGLVLAPSSAMALVIDFESMPAGELPSYTEQGVTFTAPGGPNVTATVFGNTPNGTKGIIDSTGFPWVPTRADILGGAIAVSVDIGDFDGDADDLFLQAFSAGNLLLDVDLVTIPIPFVGMVTLSVAAPDIAYVIFGGVGVGGSSVYSDNFTWEPVPEPMTVALLGAGLAGLGLTRRRRIR